jgi:DNA-binding response OmpR family regulator
MTRLGIIIDDDGPSRQIYGGILSRLGFALEEAVDGEDAIALLETRQPDIIILDLLLPRVNGLQVLDYIYSAPHLTGTRVIIITAHTSYKHTTSLRAGDSYFIKPVPASEIRAHVIRMLEENPS